MQEEGQLIINVVWCNIEIIITEEVNKYYRSHRNKYYIMLEVSTTHLKLNRLGDACQTLSLKIN
jgi:hypothetical protein